MNNRKYYDPFTGKVKSNRHARFDRQKRKNIRLISDTSSFFSSGCVWSETHGEYILPGSNPLWNDEVGKELPAKNAYPKRYWRYQGSKELKKVCNRQFRKQNKDFPGKSNAYRRYTEFWWELY